MKKGFTMIELIFVIVILGVLASVAIPRLAATRDDAEVAKAATNLTTAVSDITAYYTAKGNFKDSTSKANVTFDKLTNALDKTGNLLVKGKTKCAQIELPAIGSTSSKVNLVVNFGADGKADPVCVQLRKLPGIISMCGQSGTKTALSANANDCKIQIGGSGGIQF